jgi:carbon-monoxide dehydrogenase medium subunit
MLPDFELIEPRSLDEALDALAGGGTPLAGGTNLLVDLRARRESADRLVSLGRVDALRGIARENGQVRIGAGTTVADLLRDPLVAEEAPGLVEAARVFAGTMVRNSATVAGNLCYGSPAADLAPPLIALDAEAVLRSAEGERMVPLVDFCTGVRRTVLKRGELMTGVRWKSRPQPSAHLFHKLGLRKGDAIAVTSVALTMVAEDGACSDVRIVLGAVGPVVLRAGRAEAMLTGREPTEAVIEAAASEAANVCTPIDDLRATAEYRRHVVGVLTRRLAARAWAEIARGR